MDDQPRITERRPLGPPTIVGTYLIHVDRRQLDCPHCRGKVGALDVREVSHGLAMTCPHCHRDLIVCEGL